MNILEFIDEMAEQGIDEETACRIWSMDNDPDYNSDDYDL